MHQMTSLPDTERGGLETHTCPDCNKQFCRQCDLNKHSKSHSRPFKCHDPTCKYHDLGWPTAKELDRHNNDKHLAAPKTYPCRFQPCPYRSKRESNCKQHMEKAHGWTYVRSKAGSNSKRLPPYQAEPESESLAHNTRLSVPSHLGLHSSPVTGQSNHFPPPHEDFVLFPPEEIDQSVLSEQDDDTGFLGADLSRENSLQILPWTSPGTRLRDNERAIEHFSQTYNNSSRRPDRTQDVMIDPDLPEYHLKPDPSHPSHNGLPPVRHQRVVPQGMAVGAGRQGGPPSFAARSPVANPIAPRMEPPRIVVAGPGTATPSHASLNSALTLAQSSGNSRSFSKRSRADSDDHDEEQDQGRRPRKQPKRNHDDAFSDNQMPDIFRFAHPDRYDRDEDQKFSPCHSPHKDISTLVRHLSRPAHRLAVTERYISSFDVETEDYCHPRVGLCRRCWGTFPDRVVFEAHVAGDCEKVSKGKKEKWRSLLEAFTPIVAEPEEETRKIVTARDPRAGRIERPVPPPSPTIDLEPRTPWPLVRECFVTLSQHEKDCELAFRLGCAAQQAAGNNRVPTLKTFLEFQDPARIGNSVIGHLARSLVHDDAGDAPPMGGGRAPGTTADRANLVSQMDSRSTDVDRQGLMMEEIQELARSARRSTTLHHVRNSPPPKFDGDTSSRSQVAAMPMVAIPPPNRHPPSSNPDSGYGTDPKRHSLTETEILEHMPKGPGGSADVIDSHEQGLAQQHQQHMDAGVHDEREAFPSGLPAMQNLFSWNNPDPFASSTIDPAKGVGSATGNEEDPDAGQSQDSFGSLINFDQEPELQIPSFTAFLDE